MLKTLRCLTLLGVTLLVAYSLAEAQDTEAERRETPCGDGAMVWRCWGGGREYCGTEASGR